MIEALESAVERSDEELFKRVQSATEALQGKGELSLASRPWFVFANAVEDEDEVSALVKLQSGKDLAGTKEMDEIRRKTLAAFRLANVFRRLTRVTYEHYDGGELWFRFSKRKTEARC